MLAIREVTKFGDLSDLTFSEAKAMPVEPGKPVSNRDQLSLN
jgi:hypothetical protein